jgi:hypothetical protein
MPKHKRKKRNIEYNYKRKEVQKRKVIEEDKEELGM